jgi:hypothetical protein
MNPQIISNQTKISNILNKYKSIDDDDLKKDIARYVCVLVSGHIEESLRILINDYAKGKSSPIIQKYVDSNVKKITNCKFNKIVEILNSFHGPWAEEFSINVKNQEPIPDQYKDSIDSVVAIRHRIAHGKNTGISIHVFCI